MRKDIKKILLGILFVFLLLPMVKADEYPKCKDYTNYYFFSLMTIAGDYGNPSNSNTAYFPLPEVPVNGTTNIEHVCIQGNGNYQSGSTCSETWTKTDYWTRWLAVDAKQDIGSVNTDAGMRNYKRNITTNTSTSVISDIWHGKWTNSSGVVSETQYYPFDSSKNNATDRANATVASKVTIVGTPNETNNYIKLEIKRDLVGTEGATAIELTTDGTSHQPGFFDVAVYKVTYRSCTYNAKINYLYREDNSVAHEPHEEEELKDGYENDVESPSIAGCTPDSDSVHIKINGANFEDTVYYTCETPSTLVTIRKTSAKSDNELPGAKLVIKDKAGKIVKDINGNELQWTTEKSPKKFRLAPGTYVLSEEKAPEGYELSDKKIEFVVNDAGYVFIDDGKVENNTIIFENTPEPEQKPTGDLLIYVAWFVGLAAIGFVVYYYIKERKANVEL